MVMNASSPRRRPWPHAAALLALAALAVVLTFGTCDSRDIRDLPIPPLPPDPTVDADGDGWAPVDNDCCDTPGTCPNPALVNPGAFEVLGNGVDDDCDSSTPDDTPVMCATAPRFGGVTALELAQAMELCRSTSPAPPLPDRTWGVLSAELVQADGSSPSPAALAVIQDLQTALLADYGVGGVVPRVGPTMAGLSTGVMRDAGDPGFVPPYPGTDFGRPGAYPYSLGGTVNCPGPCPPVSGAFDSVNLRLTLRVPTNAHGFSYAFRFFSADYLSDSCTLYNDMHVARMTGGAPGIPYDRNIAFDTQSEPISVNSDFIGVCMPYDCHACPQGFGELLGTGMDIGNQGGGTGWLRTRAPVLPGETITLELMIFDSSDGIVDSVALLDGFEWSVDPTIVVTMPEP